MFPAAAAQLYDFKLRLLQGIGPRYAAVHSISACSQNGDKHFDQVIVIRPSDYAKCWMIHSGPGI